MNVQILCLAATLVATSSAFAAPGLGPAPILPSSTPNSKPSAPAAKSEEPAKKAESGDKSANSGPSKTKAPEKPSEPPPPAFSLDGYKFALIATEKTLVGAQDNFTVDVKPEVDYAAMLEANAAGVKLQVLDMAGGLIGEVTSEANPPAVRFTADTPSQRKLRIVRNPSTPGPTQWKLSLGQKAAKKAGDAPPSDSKPAEEKPADKPAEKPAEEKKTAKPADPKPTEAKPAEPKKDAEKPGDK